MHLSSTESVGDAVLIASIFVAKRKTLSIGTSEDDGLNQKSLLIQHLFFGKILALEK